MSDITGDTVDTSKDNWVRIVTIPFRAIIALSIGLVIGTIYIAICTVGTIMRPAVARETVQTIKEVLAAALEFIVKGSPKGNYEDGGGCY